MSHHLFIHPQKDLRDMLIYSSVLRKIRSEISEDIPIHYFILHKHVVHVPFLFKDLKNIQFVEMDSLNPKTLKLFITFSKKYSTSTKHCFGEIDIFRNDSKKDAHLSMTHDHDLSIYDITDKMIFDNFRYFPQVATKDNSKFIKKFSNTINIISSISSTEAMNLTKNKVWVDFSKMFPAEDAFFHDSYTLFNHANSIHSLGNSALTVFLMFLKYHNMINVKDIHLFNEEETVLLYQDIWTEIN